MQNETKNSAAVVGVFTDLDQAQKAVRDLKSENVGTHVRLIENDFSEDLDNRHEQFRQTDQVTAPRPEAKGGVSGFFARLFGMEDDRSDDLRLNADSELYFKDSYQKKHHFVVIDTPVDPVRARHLLISYGAVIEERGNELYEQERFQTQRAAVNRVDENKDFAVMELREEQLNVGKDRVQTGEVHVRKEIIHETKTVEIPLVREEIVIETRSLSGTPQAGTIGSLDASDRQEIRIPVSEEQVRVEKTVVPREEIRISKERVVEQRVVSEDLQHEEALLEEDGRVSISEADRAKIKAKLKAKSQLPPDDQHAGL